MAVFKCKMCGGALEANSETVAVCQYCGTKQTLPKTNDDVISNLFNRANNLRLKCEFDKAALVYEKIVEQDDSEAEAHWGIVLCKYGIEYVEDPKTQKRIPTCHRTLFEAVTTDADYLAAIDYSDSLQQQIYEAEARAIDRIQKDILNIVKNEKPFDVFICYKETDENGKRTIDSAIANDIYYQLSQEGFKVFFAAITLEDKLGQEYEPYIFAALNSAKVMLVLGTKPEYFSAVWVKNEWSRFLQLMKTNRSKLLIPCYRDMDAYDLPEEFAHLQAQDMSKIGFINDVVRGIKKIAQTDVPKQVVVKEPALSGGNANTVSLMKRAFMFLEDGDWATADEYCEKVLDIDPENASAYLGKLMAELQVNTQGSLQDYPKPFDGNNNYQKAVRFADEKFKSVLVGYTEHIRTRNENARLESVYRSAKSAMASAKTERIYVEIAQAFESVAGYMDASSLAQVCYEKAEEARKDAVLAEAKSWMTDAIPSLQRAISMFESIAGWKDADEQVFVCRKKIREIEAQAEADRLAKERREELARIEAARVAKRNKKIMAMATAITCAAIAFIVLLNTVIIPDMKYRDAVSLARIGNFIEAYEKFVALDDYKDSAEKAEDIYCEYSVETLKLAQVGDSVFFGAYEQDNDISNGQENIEWIVLEITDGKVLLISKYALDCVRYNEEYATVTWESCTLRKWLNNDFVNAAFSEKERELISAQTVSSDPNLEGKADYGKTTQDKVFVLRTAEIHKYLNQLGIASCKPTAYAQAQGTYVHSSNGNCHWWLRSPSNRYGHTITIQNDGNIYRQGDRVDYAGNAVRPVLWVDISKTK